MSEQISEYTGLEVAVVGMALRMPEANSVEEYWDNLISGRNCISFFSDEELREAGIDEAAINNPNYVKAKGVLKDAMSFDPDLFGYSHREAMMMDPQLRVYHECVYQALDDAGYNGERSDLAIGLYGGAGENIAWRSQFQGQQGLANFFASLNVTGPEFFNTRVANKLDLKGPALTVQTACSSSLVAVHLAVQGLIMGDSDLAVAGGVEMTTNPFAAIPDKHGYLYQEGMVNSEDGYCRPFDAKGNGTLLSDGGGAVVLKRLADAIEDGDEIYAVIKGSACNNDGKEKTGYTAPSVSGQAAVITAALSMAEIEPARISYVEAHGTGTSLGDPIEVKALTQAYQDNPPRHCWLGAVKSNIGHLGVAAGIAGFIKTALVLKHQTVPPTLHYETPNEEIDFSEGTFEVCTSVTELQRDELPLCAAVSSFGIGGTNAHVILEQFQPEARHRDSVDDSPQVISLSAQTKESVEAQASKLAKHLSKNPALQLHDIAYTLRTGRAQFEHRLAVVASSTEELQATLEKKAAVNRIAGKAQDYDVIWMFPGQGSQYQKMAVDLYYQQEAFKSTVDHCFSLLKEPAASNLKALFFGQSDDLEAINETQNTQPLLFIVEYALAQYYFSIGVKPNAMIGHSLGELVAATIAQVMDLETALSLVCVRGALMASTPIGGMLAVAMPASELQLILPQELEIAALNSDAGCVVSGSVDGISAFTEYCASNNVMHKALPTKSGYHSYLMDDALSKFTTALSKMTFHAPKVRFVSNVSGEWITDEQAQSPQYWAQHIRQAVKFSPGIDTILASTNTQCLFLELGPGNTLSSFVKQKGEATRSCITVSSLRRVTETQPDLDVLLQSVGKLHCHGIDIDWSALSNQSALSRLHLPAYQFNRSPFIPQISTADKHSISAEPEHDGTLTHFYPNWQSELANKHSTASLLEKIKEPVNWLLFINDAEEERYAKLLREAGHRVLCVYSGTHYEYLREDTYQISPEKTDDYQQLFSELAKLKAEPEYVLHLWAVPVQPLGNNPLDEHQIGKKLSVYYYSLINIAKEIGAGHTQKAVRLMVTSCGVYSVIGESVVEPYKAPLLGAVTVINQEYANISCQHIDLGSTGANSDILHYALSEWHKDKLDLSVAYRGEYRWHRGFETHRKVSQNDTQDYLKENGHYLITGGLGALSLALSKDIASRHSVTLSLMARTPLPDRDIWPHYLATHFANDVIAQKIMAIQEIEALGSQVNLLQADISDFEQTKKSIESVADIDGVIHAAGVPSGGAIQTKARVDSDKVFAPKVLGTLNLSRALADQQLDFVCLYSSITAIMGGFGQADYCGANAFLDAAAQSNLFANANHVNVINWDAWQDIGMAANYQQNMLSTQGQTIHPLLGTCIEKNDETAVFKSILTGETCWFMNEHVIYGKRTLPGTAYLEMARAACGHLSQEPQAELSDVYFLSPLTLDVNETAVLKTTVKIKDGQYQFEVSSQSERGTISQHAKGVIKAITEERTEAINLVEKMATLAENAQRHDLGKTMFGQQRQADQEFYYGQHWNNFEFAYLSPEQELLQLGLDDQFIPELSVFGLHPSLLDCATTSAVGALNNNFFIPVHYNKLRFYRPLVQRCVSVIKVVQSKNGVHEADLSIFDEHGQLLVEIIGFSKREIAKDDFAGAQPQHSEQPTVSSDRLAHGIATNDGLQAFHYAMNLRLKQSLISTQNVPSLLKGIHNTDSSSANESGEQAAVTKRPRPDLATEYVPASSEIEQRLTSLWQDMLAIEMIGVNDNFFELGGDSLVLMQIHSRLGELFESNVAIAELYDKATIAGLAAIISAPKAEQGNLKDVASERAEKMKMARKKRQRGAPRR